MTSAMSLFLSKVHSEVLGFRISAYEFWERCSSVYNTFFRIFFWVFSMHQYISLYLNQPNKKPQKTNKTKQKQKQWELPPPSGSKDVKWNGISALCHDYYFILDLTEKWGNNSCLGWQGNKSSSWEVCSEACPFLSSQFYLWRKLI